MRRAEQGVNRTDRSLLSRVVDPREDRTQDLFLVARTLAEGLYHGRHRTPDRGASTEFYDYRAYVPGDPIQRVDWRLFGRTDRYYIRRFQQESQLNVMLVVDASASMDFAGLDAASNAPTKFQKAQELAALLAYLAVRQGDRIGIVLIGGRDASRKETLRRFSRGPEEHVTPSQVQVVPPGPGWSTLHSILNILEHSRPQEVQTGVTQTLAMGLHTVQSVMKRRGIVIAISDGLEEVGPMIEGAARIRFGGGGLIAAQGSEIGLIQILAPDEIELPRRGAGTFIDSERDLAVQANLSQVSSGYRSLMESHINELRSGVMSMGGRYVLGQTSQHTLEIARQFIAER